MTWLIDANVFLRFVSKSDPHHQSVMTAIRLLMARQEELYYTSQVLAEFWTVCTRPVMARGGFGLTPAQTERKARLIERYCRLLPDTLATHQEWRRLIVRYAVSGVEVHDARLVAAMQVYQITHLLTINSKDFDNQ